MSETDKAITNLVSEVQGTIQDKRNNQERLAFENTLNKILSDYY
ncbi:hypothetical protein [Candidatus Nitrosocosmicus franklandus]|uniref:Uncharacterized protein n=1 Tax=Candidatus Nitrosocosmicus franklandianus TaxID=1798806 RepID=A0A484IFC2_9ARCH|nr:hypothetical protein [Candidatus Nitrosocosmicus franklandus]VFJ14322.1 protein of unknown function [Candidatus Nitrosocosmicus franklandus]